MSSPAHVWHYFVGWVPVFSTATEPVARAERNVSLQLAAFLTSNCSHIEKRQISSAVSALQGLTYLVRNDGIVAFAMSTNVDAGKEDLAAWAAIVFEAIKGRAKHLDIFHGVVSGFKFTFRPVEVTCSSWKNLTEGFHKNEILAEIQTKASPQVVALYRYRENFGRAVTSILEERERIRKRFVVSNIPLFFAIVVLLSLTAPVAKNWITGLTLGSFVIFAIILPLVAIGILTQLDDGLSYVRRVRPFEFMLSQRSVRRVVVPIGLTLLFAEIAVRTFSTNAGDALELKLVEAVTAHNWTELDKKFALLIAVFGIGFQWAIEVFYKRNFILKAIEYAKGTLAFGSIYSRVLETVVNAPVGDFDYSSSALDALKLHEVRKWWNAHITAAIAIFICLLIYLVLR